jgi:hypothetical protein
VPVWAWSEVTRAKVKQRCEDLIRGVGVAGSEVWEWGEVALHVRRLVTSSEMAVVGPATDER